MDCSAVWCPIVGDATRVAVFRAFVVEQGHLEQVRELAFPADCVEHHQWGAVMHLAGP